ncbi:MAG: hypothetical protein LVQ63_06860, partial [Thermoplasmatales archaeon]|nr:hypothetical protein [Thermoplasmatales archaeon]
RGNAIFERMNGFTTIRFIIFLKTPYGNCSRGETNWNPALLIKTSIPRKCSSALFTTSLQLSGFDRTDFMKNVLSPSRAMSSGTSFLSTTTTLFPFSTKEPTMDLPVPLPNHR